MTYPVQEVLLAMTVAGIVVAGGLGLFAWPRRDRPAATAFAALMLVDTVWLATHGATLLADGPAATLTWHTATRTIQLFLAPAFLWVVLAYAGVSHRRTVRAVTLTAGLTTLVAVAHGWLFWTDGLWAAVDPVAVGDVLLLRVDRTPLGWAFVAYVYAILAGSFLVLFRLYRSTGRVSRRQVGVFAGASVVPTAANVVYVLEIGPIPAFDATPYAFLAFGILTFGAVVGFRFLESRPVGRSTLFESLSEPVVVLDERNRIVDSNPAARALPGVDVGPDGDPLADAVPTLGRAVATGADTVAIGDRLFDVETNPVTDDRGNQRGRLVLLTDVTDRHRREVALRDLQEATNRMLERDSVEGVAAVAAAAARRVLGADRAVVRLREGDRLLPVATAVPDGGDATDEGRSRDSPEGDASTVTPAPWADGTVRTGDLDDEGHPDPVSVDDSVHGDALRAGRPVATEGQGPPPARTADGTSTDTDHPVVTLHVPLGDGGVLSAVDPDPRPGALASAPGTVGRADDETVASAGAVPSPSDGSGDSVGAGAPDDADPTTVASTAAAAASDREDGRDVGDRTAALADLLGTSAGASVARARRRADLAERTDRLDRFASVLSHDLRNPLSVAQGYLELAREAVEDPTVSGYLESSADGIERLDALIDDLLLLARDGPGEDRLAPVSVTAVAKEAWDTVDTGDATLVADGAVRVEADRSNLRRAIENLFRNAIEHGEADAVRVEPTPDGERPGFRVADDGHGVPPALEESLFERGVSGDDGTGLGLAVVRSVVEGHGWTIAYDPSPAGGAQFSVYFDDRSD